MKCLSRIIVFITLMFASINCTNNGNIGFLYGLWLLEDFTIDGVEADIEVSHYNWRFQSNIIQIDEVIEETGHYVESFGTWKMIGNDELLELNFTHVDSETSSDSPAYNPPFALGIPPRSITIMRIIAHTDSRMTLSFVNAEGETLVYKFKKSY